MSKNRLPIDRSVLGFNVCLVGCLKQIYLKKYWQSAHGMCVRACVHVYIHVCEWVYICVCLIVCKSVSV